MATPAERERLDALRALGLHDVLRTRLGDEQVFSWWDYRGGNFHRGMGLRIDLVWCSPRLATAVTDAFVDRNARKGPKPSDHAPVVVDLDWPR